MDIEYSASMEEVAKSLLLTYPKPASKSLSSIPEEIVIWYASVIPYERPKYKRKKKVKADSSYPTRTVSSNKCIIRKSK